MRRISLILLLLTALLIVPGCDTTGLPTPTAVPSTPTPQAAAQATTAPIDTPTSQPIAAPTDASKASPTPLPIIAATPQTSLSPTKAAVTPRPTARPLATRRPITTAQPASESPTLLPEIGSPPPFVTTIPIPRLPTVTSRPLPTATSSIPSAGGTQLPTVEPPPTPTATPDLLSRGWGEVTRAAPGRRRIALTFDAGSTGEAMPAILAALRERGIHITMFFTGKYAEQYPDGVRQAATDGNEIANHTYSHLDSRTLTDAQLADELARTETILQNLTGRTSKPYWRPPFGARDDRVLRAAAAQGYRSIYWTLDSLDSVGQPKTPDFLFNRVTHPPSNVNLDGAIVLQHFGSQASAEALPRELDALQAMGLQVVTVSELISP